MDTTDKLKLMQEIKNSVIKYLEEQKSINEDALRAYEDTSPIQDEDSEIKMMREKEAIKIRDRIYELKKHIAVINLMIPKIPAAIVNKTAKKKS